MACLAKINEDTIMYDEVSFSSDLSSFYLKSSTGIVNDFEFRFKGNYENVRPEFQNLNESFEEVFLFKNPYLSTNKVYEVKSNDFSTGTGLIGYLVPMQIITDDLILDISEFHTTAIYRSIINLFKNTAIPNIIPGYKENYTLFDFYPMDIFVGVFPFVFTRRISDFNLLRDYIVPLSTLGFTIIRKPEHLNYNPKFSDVQDSEVPNAVNFNSNYSDSCSLRLEKLTITLSSKEFFYNLLLDYNKEETNYISRFLLFYQVIEILNDLVLKKDLNELWDAMSAGAIEKSGYELKHHILEIGQDPFKFKNLINKYASIKSDFEYLKLKLDEILESYCGIKINTQDDWNLDRLIYKLRNNIVHNLQFIYSSNLTSQSIIEKIDSVLSDFEYLILLIIKNFRY